MKSRFNIIAVFVLIVIFPLVSWMYLKKGEEWHVNTKSELENLGQVNQNLVFIKDGLDPVSVNELEGKIILYFHTDNSDATRDLTYIANQFADNDNIILSVNNHKYYPEDLKEHLYIIEQGSLNSVKNESADYALLFDTKHELRKQYDVLNLQELSKLIEHTALLLPYETKADIKIKKVKEK